MVNLSKETHPEYFYKGSAVDNLVDARGFKTAKDLSEVFLVDNS